MIPQELEDETDNWRLVSFDYFSSPTRMFSAECKHCDYHTGKDSRKRAMQRVIAHLVGKQWHEEDK